MTYNDRLYNGLIVMGVALSGLGQHGEARILREGARVCRLGCRLLVAVDLHYIVDDVEVVVYRVPADDDVAGCARSLDKRLASVLVVEEDLLLPSCGVVVRARAAVVLVVVVALWVRLDGVGALIVQPGVCEKILGRWAL